MLRIGSLGSFGRTCSHRRCGLGLIPRRKMQQGASLVPGSSMIAHSAIMRLWYGMTDGVLEAVVDAPYGQSVDSGDSRSRTCGRGGSMRWQSLMAIGVMVCMCACASSRSGQVYTREQARTAHTVYTGTVLQVQEVTIEGTQSGAGAVLGGALGAAAGQTIGGGSGRVLGTVGGAVGGALAGSALEKKATTAAGLEITVELDNGRVIAVVQEKDDDYQVGDRVRVLEAPDGTTRIRQ